MMLFTAIRQRKVNHYDAMRKALTPDTPSPLLVMGIDPGPTHSAYAVVQEDYSIVRACKLPNDEVREDLRSLFDRGEVGHVAIEGIVCYGRPVGRETFETAYMVGEIQGMCRVADVPYTIYARPEYANAIAGCGKVTDAILYQALRLRFGGANKGEPLYALKGESDLRSAFAIAVYSLDCQAALICHDLPVAHTEGRAGGRSAQNKRTYASHGHRRERG